jgi:L-ascorbate metabolism protein UlaG (beta-lactamase superfamily)
MKQERLQAAYIGGPTALFEWHGFRLLTDPTFDPPGGKYQNGPVVLEKTIGPARAPEALGCVDTVLLSHDHHLDNLDHSGRRFLASVPRVITTPEGAEPLGGNSVGFAVWQSIDIAGGDGRVLRITGTPAQHGPAHLQRGAVIGFVVALADAPGSAIYFSGDTVWFDRVAEVAQRFPIRAAVLFMGAARVPVVGPFALTMTAEDGAQAAHAFSEATIVPIHFEGWKHLSESREVISRAFEAAGVSGRVRWMEAGTVVDVGG